MKIINLQIDFNCGNSFIYTCKNPALGHLFVRFKSHAKVLTSSGFAEANPGDFIFFRQDDYMEYGTENGVFLHDFFRFTLSEEEASFFSVESNVLFRFGLSDALESIFMLLFAEYVSLSSYREENLALIGKLFLTKAAEYTTTQHSNIIADSRYRMLLPLRLEILNSPQKNWSIDILSKKSMLSPSHFQTLYKKFFGNSCMDDIINARIKMAKDLLLCSDRTESEISQLCGYNNVEHFIRQFKKRQGITPSQYKKCKANDFINNADITS